MKKCFATKKNLSAFVIKNRIYSEPDDPMVIFPHVVGQGTARFVFSSDAVESQMG